MSEQWPASRILPITEGESEAAHLKRLHSFTMLAVTWVDTTNIAEWTALDDIGPWAREQTFIVTNVGYLVYEDDECVVLAARLAVGKAQPEQAGLFERIPKAVIERRREILQPMS